MIKAVLFDIDNTLYSYDDAHRQAWGALTDYARERLDIPAERFEALHREAARTLTARCGGGCAAVHNRLIRYQILLEGAHLPIRHAPAMAELYWSTLLDAAAPFPGTAEGLALLREAGCTVGIGTNMTADRQFQKLERLGLIELVDFMVTSEEVGAEKPDRRLFDCCAEKAGCESAACVFVGDDEKSDVLGALRAGMHPVRFCPTPPADAPEPDVPRISRLTELPALLPALGRKGVGIP